MAFAVPGLAQEAVLSAVPVGYHPQVFAVIIWLCLWAFIVFFNQAGFAMVETGLTRSKNAVNIMTKNLLDFSFGALLFWAIGYAIMYASGDANFLGFDAAFAFLDTGIRPARGRDAACVQVLSRCPQPAQRSA
jgi:Amt family ammonium transporter